MRRCLLAALWAGMAMLLLLCACDSGAQQEPSGVMVYFVDDDTGEHAGLGSALRGEGYDPTHPEVVPTVDELLSALLAGPKLEGLRSPIPAQAQLLGWSLEEGGLLRLDLSEHYGELSGVELTLADYCITLTLCQLEGITAVEITVAGHALSFRDHQVLTAQEVLTSGALEGDTD